EHYQHLVRDYNFSNSPHQVPLMSGSEKRELIRNRVANAILFVRRYGFAKLAYEAALHQSDPCIYEGVIGKVEHHAAGLEKIYGRLMGRAYGIPMYEDDTARYLTDVRPFFENAESGGAFILAAQIQEALRKRFGPKWFASSASGKLLLNLFAEGKVLSG